MTNNQSNNRSESATISFNKLWKNIVIRNQIIYFIRLYNIHSNPRTFKSIQSLNKYKYKEYLKSVNIVPSNSIDKEYLYLLFDEFNEIPSLESIELIGSFKIYEKDIEFDSIKIPTVKSIKIVNLNTSEDCIFSNCNTVQIVSPISNCLTTIFSNIYSLQVPCILPSTLVSLTLSKQFNSELPPGVLPSSLTLLNLGFAYNLPIKQNVLPESLKSIYFSKCFDSQINENVLPQSLEIIEFSDRSNFDKPLNENVLPVNLKKLILPNLHCQKVILPINLKVFKSGRKIPSNIMECTKLNTLNLQYLGKGTFVTEDNIPMNSISKLVIPNQIVISNSSLQFNENLTNLKFESFYYQLKKVVIPTHVLNLDLDWYEENDFLLDTYQQLVNLNSLSLGLSQNYLTSNTFPIGLKHLRIHRIELPIDLNILPSTLISLSIFTLEINSLNHSPLTPTSTSHKFDLPNLIILEICNSININSDWLPPLIEILIIHNKNSKIELPLPSSLHSIYVKSTDDTFSELTLPLINILKPIEKLDKIYQKIKKQL